MAQPRKPSIVRFIEESATEELHLVLRGHLHVEAILNEIARRSVANPEALDDLRQSFFSKVKLLRALDRIDEKTELLLLALNSLRNKLAHQSDFAITFADAYALVRTAAEAGVDFSDDTIYADEKLSEESYGTTGVLMEVISNTFQQLVWRNEDIFFNEDISDFLG